LRTAASWYATWVRLGFISLS